ncbi:hypothetical protein [Clostridium septicum]|uniref:Zn-finger containing protein n=1 Tax=Clostridium septicum TaxID=1504 RepID=A0A9N7JIC4_CLOSE|nr:hypothetical protein [Clostridium septicum]AYE33018.1 hypothetical protein CP523_00415 [Clostridium septicum]MDU1313411.1 hypothetical protein [Clostridium septicum]QAS61187.1 hypothetical protein EI377_10905 [Clostridium septicum]UEC19465.1 hypothetical protein LK444_08490 [Clostridium septicum]USR99582.1 hypothetical protein NH397_08695 [Clostridium septicum]
MRFLRNAYGIDILSIFLIFLGSIFNIFNLTKILGLLFVLLAIFRCFSKNKYKRRDELDKFIFYLNKVLNKFGKSIPKSIPIIDFNSIYLLVNIFKQQRNKNKGYKITKCPNCKQKLRLPKGKGNIIVTCTKCKVKFDLKT